MTFSVANKGPFFNMKIFLSNQDENHEKARPFAGQLKKMFYKLDHVLWTFTLFIEIKHSI